MRCVAIPMSAGATSSFRRVRLVIRGRGRRAAIRGDDRVDDVRLARAPDGADRRFPVSGDRIPPGMADVMYLLGSTGGEAAATPRQA